MSLEIGDKATVIKGRMKGEVVEVIGESNLNMECMIIVRRNKGRKRTMAFAPHWLAKVTKGKS